MFILIGREWFFYYFSALAGVNRLSLIPTILKIQDVTPLISLAGPSSNFLLAILLSIILRLLIFFQLKFLITIGAFLFLPLIQLNIILGIFNLLPIHPLDGFKIVSGVLSEEKARDWYSLQRYGIFFLLLLIIPFGGSSMLETILGPVINFFYKILIPFSSSSGII